MKIQLISSGDNNFKFRLLSNAVDVCQGLEDKFHTEFKLKLTKLKYKFEFDSESDVFEYEVGPWITVQDRASFNYEYTISEIKNKKIFLQEMKIKKMI